MYVSCKELDWDLTNFNLQKTIADIEEHENNITGCEAQIERQEYRIKELEQESLVEKVVKLQDQVDKDERNPETDELSLDGLDIIHHLEGLINTVKKNVLDAETLRDRAVEKIQSLQVAITRLKMKKQLDEKLAKEKKALNRKELDIALQKYIDLYVPGSLRFTRDTNYTQRLKISMKFKPSIARSADPLYDESIGEYYWQHIEISSLMVHFHMFSGRVSVTIGKPGDARAFRGYPRAYVPHPHMTSATDPCLGDFGGNITESLQAADVVSAASVMAAFVQSFYPDDPAGRYWRNWPHNDSDQHYIGRTDPLNPLNQPGVCDDDDECDEDSEEDPFFSEDDSDGVYVACPTNPNQEHIDDYNRQRG